MSKQSDYKKGYEDAMQPIGRIYGIIRFFTARYN